MVLSDGIHMNSYFYLSSGLSFLLIENQLKYGTIFCIDKFQFVNGKDCKNQSPRQIIVVQKMSILIHRNIIGDPLPLINVEIKNSFLINLNLNEHTQRKFQNFNELENNLRFVKELSSEYNGKCSHVLKLKTVKKYSINSYRRCQVLNLNMEDYTGMIRVCAFNSLSIHINNLLQEGKTYYITDTILKRNNCQYGFELKLQPYSVIIECPENMISDVLPFNIPTFEVLLSNCANTFCDLIGICIEINNIEVCNITSDKIEIAKRDIVLIDKSMRTVTLKIWGENVNKFEGLNNCNPVIFVKQAILKEFNKIKYFTTQKASNLLINPSTLVAFQLKEWYKSLSSIEDL
ncbi:replication protein A 70 kDa DNA-binding subunit-like isoform X2 [Daktulosphaira vitifoliae]|nr:replication protein A 70 kDa DNA-binding subunit-like isoform X2 [Daktulosphaira vitifoliae]XP_050542357.1 replication protein A 70 kDa DNA-binding subunit-like isoform X2 [Daktulosphaira vitifoliae]